MKTERLLSHIPLFNSLSTEDIDWLSSRAKKRTLCAGEVLFKEGDSGHELFILAEGEVRVSMSGAKGEDIELARLESGAFFGEMAIIEHSPRSATCTAIGKALCLSLSDEDFEGLIRERPEAAMRILQRMLEISSSRLLNTGSFLSQMVRWGDDARKRAVTDEASGLFNRRYLDDSLESWINSAKRDGSGLCMAMFDLDRFGTMNAEYGPAFCDALIVSAAELMKRVFHKDDVLVRYGGDEFCFVLPRPSTEAQASCAALCAELRALHFPEHPQLRVTCSIGVACLRPYDLSAREILDRADRALYQAKEAGRDRVVVFAEEGARDVLVPRAKIANYSVPGRNRVVDSILRLIQARQRFLIFGHQNPDEDCFSSMVAFALLLRKFKKDVQLFLRHEFPSNLSFMAEICRFNEVKIIRDMPEKVPDTLVLLDTPKSDMIEGRELIDTLRAEKMLPLIELDHHLAADSDQYGDEGISLVMETSSTCEIIAMIVFKLASKSEILERANISELFSRNIVLAILSGMIGDSGMGKYLKSPRVRWFYRLYTRKLEKILNSQTISGSGNIANNEQVFGAIAELSAEENRCLAILDDLAQREEGLHWVFVDMKKSLELAASCGSNSMVSASKVLANTLAEGSGQLGLVGYYEGSDPESLVQFRLRRAGDWNELDLREVLETLGIHNGGGHAGAVGFRCLVSDMGDPDRYIRSLLDGLRSLLNALSSE
jgi:diguanylate cyclase (GGDEF)-like protein